MCDKLLICFTCPSSKRVMKNVVCLNCFLKSREEASQDPNWKDPVLDGRARVTTAPEGSICFKCGE